MRKLLAVLLTSLLLLFLAGCGGDDAAQKAEPEPQGKFVSVTNVQKQADALMVSATAVAEAGREADLSFGASGTIMQVFAGKGMSVKQGQVLAQAANGTPQGRRIEEIRLEEAQRKLQASQEELLRSEALYMSGAIAKVDYERRQREVEDAAGAVEQAGQSLADTTLVAPFAGIVADIYQQPGEMTGPGTPVIKLVNLSEIKLTMDVPVELIENYRPGVEAAITSESGRASQGKVTSVSPVADAKTGKYRVEVMVDNAKSEWRGGMLAKVELPRSLVSGIVLPLSCVGINQDTRYVLLLEDGVAKRRTVKVGQVMGSSIEILEGLNEGDKVISTGIAYIVDGEKITAKGE